MTYDPRYLRERSKELIHARNWGVGLITTLLGIGLFVSEVRRLGTLASDPMNYGYLALFLLSGVLTFLWIWATQKEFDLVFEWLDPERYEPPSSLKETLLILGLGALLSAMFFASRDPLLFASVFTLYSLMQLCAGRYLKREIDVIVDKSRNRARADLETAKLRRRAELYLNGIEVLESYHRRRPMILRSLLILVFSLVGLGLAILWRVTQSLAVGLSSYLVFVLTISVSEIAIGRWRNVRDRELRPIAAELRELLRDNGHRPGRQQGSHGR